MENKEKKMCRAVLVGHVIAGFVFGKDILDIGRKAMKYFPDCTSIGSKYLDYRYFQDHGYYFQVSENFGLVDLS